MQNTSEARHFVINDREATMKADTRRIVLANQIKMVDSEVVIKLYRRGSTQIKPLFHSEQQSSRF